MSLMRVDALTVGYGDLVAVHEVSFEIEEGAIFVLLGANGVGKTSLLRCISGLLAPKSGDVSFSGRSLLGLSPHRIVYRGVSHVPEGRCIFPNLSVEENLAVSFVGKRTQRTLMAVSDEVYELFPRLAERRRQLAGTMSGGEQQMLAIGRALMNSPRLLMLDEPSLGLSPLMAELVFDRLMEIQRHGKSILLVEQNASCLECASHGLILSNGRTVLAGERAALEDSEFVRRAYLGL
jgi:branched-chain amino acid transport system ATP-binding protein